MGLFSSKKKTVVTTAVTRMIEDKDIKSTQHSALIDHVLSSSIQVESDIEVSSLADQLKNAHANSVVAKMGRLYIWAKNGNYHYGLPKASVAYQVYENVEEELQHLLDLQHKVPVQIEYALLDEPNPFHFGWFELDRIHGYDRATNTIPGLSAWEGSACYLVDMVVHYCKPTRDAVTDDDYYYQHGVSASAGMTPVRKANPKAPHTGWVADDNAKEDFVRVTYGFMRSGQWVQKSIDLSLAEYIVLNNPDADEVMGDEQDGNDSATFSEDAYVMGCYTFLHDGVEVRKLFTYLYGSGTYPTLDSIYSPTESTGQFYPRIYARLDGTNLAHESLKDTDAYKDSVRAGRKTDLGWVNFVGQIHDNMSDTGSVQQAFVSVALAADSRDPLIHEYMFRYFTQMYKSSTAPRVSSIGGLFKADSEYIQYQAKQGARINIADKVYTQYVSYDAIGVVDLVGKVADVGKYTYSRGEIAYFGGNFFARASKPYHSYCYQLTENTYREVRIYGLSTGHQVNGGHWTSASGDSDNLLIPVDRLILKEFRMAVREILHSKALHIVFNTLKVIKTKWYQTGVFKAILFIAAVVMSVWTGGQSLTFYVVLMAAAQTILVGLVLNLVAKLAVKLGVNIQIITVIAVVAMIYAGYLAIEGVTGVMDVSAQTLLKASNAALNFTGRVAQEELKGIAEERSEFESSAKAKEDAMADRISEIGLGPSVIDPGIFTARPADNFHYLNLYQTPNDYYTRTVHTGNPGVMCFDMIANYVEQALALPTAHQTLASLQGRY